MRVVSGGLQKSSQVCFIRPLFFKAISLDMIFCFRTGEISSVRGWYTFGSFKCDIALVMYSSRSST